MRKIINATSNFNAIDRINLTGADTMENFAKNNTGEKMRVLKAAIVDRVDEETGEVTKSFAVVTDKGSFVGISQTTLQQVEDIIDLFTDEPDSEIYIKPVFRKSKAGRDFIVLELC